MAYERILVIDDEPGMRHYLTKLLKNNEYQVREACDGQEGLQAVQDEVPDLILVDFKMPNMDGMQFLAKLKEEHEDMPVIMMTAFGTIDNAIRAMKMGAYDYINKPFEIDEILIVIAKALEKKQLEEENVLLRKKLESQYTYQDIISRSDAMQSIFETIESVSNAKSHVLIQGETGTGKELVAHAIHNAGQMKDKSFVTVDCAALSETLLESELFGHVKGAFTGATQDKKGLFEEANGGTLFLDEIGHVSLDIQVKLLRALDDGVIKRVGDTKTKKVDIRLIAAANENLQELVTEGGFREDLFFRLNVIMMEIPPLRERKEDVPLLVEHFLQKYNRLERKNIQSVSEDAMTIMVNYVWPGNVRELENFIHRAVVVKKSPIINPRDLPAEMTQSIKGERRNLTTRSKNFNEAKRQAVESFEKRFIIEALKEFQGNVSKASRSMDLDRRNLQRKMKALGITPQDYA